MSRYYFKEPKKGLYPTEELSLKVYKLLTEKGKEMKRAGTFSKDDWSQYVISLGCEFEDQSAPRGFRQISVETFVLDSERVIIFRDEHYFTQLEESKVWNRLIKLDIDTAMKIATLGLP